MAQYKVLAESFINDRLCQPGEVIEYADKPGYNLELIEAEKPAPPAEKDLLDGNTESILSALPELSDAELSELLARETAGKTRKGVIEGINAEIAKRADANPVI